MAMNTVNLSSKPNNRSNTLRLFFSHEKLSRTEIASHLNITTAAVTSIIKELLETGLLLQCDEVMDSSSKKAGRKQSPLQLNYNWKYLIVIDIYPDFFHLAITNLRGAPLTEKSFPFPSPADPEQFCNDVAQKCITLLWNKNIFTEQILGVGVTIIGSVDHIQGIALNPFQMFDRPVPLKKYLQRELPFPIAMESNVCAFLQGELLYRKYIGDAQNILTLKWGPGIGSATAINGSIYKGYQFQSSEIGHNSLPGQKGILCRCGRLGCLETAISVEALIKHIDELQKSEADPQLVQALHDLDKPSESNLHSYFNIDSPSLQAYLEECTDALAAATNNAILILAPEKLILFGDIFRNDRIFSMFTKQLYESNPYLPENFCIRSLINSSQRYIGATAVAIENSLLKNSP